jgi:hypothetical protein
MATTLETSRLFALERGGVERLELRWDAGFKQIRVLFDGGEVASLERKKIPRDGTKVTLPDGSVLSLRLRGLLGMELLRGGEAVPESDLDPRRVLRNAAVLMGVAAVVDVGWDLLLRRQAINLALMAQFVEDIPHVSPWPFVLDGALLFCAVPTFLGSRAALAIGIAAFAGRYGLRPGQANSAWTTIYGIVTTWLLAMHFFALTRRKRP